MKKLILSLLLILSVMFTACSDDDNEGLSREEEIAKIQTEMYNAVLSNIQGHWKGYQHYNASIYRPTGWEDISYIRWTQEYVFNSDGTCKDIYSQKLIYEGAYSIIKNEDFKYPGTDCELFLVITYSKDDVRKSAIWMDGEYLRIGSALMGLKPSATSGGEASIRYKKE